MSGRRPFPSAVQRLKLLVDESLSITVARSLEEAGHDAVHVGGLGLLGAAASEAMLAGADGERVLISAGTDFGELLAIGRKPGLSVVLLRRAPHLPQAQERLILEALSVLEADLQAGAVAVVSPGRLRVRETAALTEEPIGSHPTSLSLCVALCLTSSHWMAWNGF